ncbi:MAG: DUF748 domain-containing protein [Desulfobacteraceae bacterium]|nr:DUF748 domain-containing protein [Desulfobacteraceae bacterium]
MKKFWYVGASILGFLILLVIVGSFFVDEPLRRYIEGEMNRRLTGYSVSIRTLDFHPAGFSLDLRGLTVKQNANPSPPVASIQDLHASVHWHALLHARIVSDFRIDKPRVYLNLKNIRSEEASKVPLKNKGWQKALEAVYPFKINVLTINDGDITYIDEGPSKPLHVSSIQFEAHNIRNVVSPKQIYPSRLRMSGIIFGSGKMALDGQANFLAVPYPGVKARIAIENMEMGYFEPIAKRHDIVMKQGALSVDGGMEYAPGKRVVHLTEVQVRNPYFDYVHTAGAAPKEKKAARKTARAAKEVSNQPAIRLRIDKLEMTQGNFGMINTAAHPNYRIFIDHLDLILENLSNHFSEGPAHLTITGRFMGSGETRASGVFRSEAAGPDFHLNIAIANTSMPAMNNLFRAYGKFDVAAGLFSFYSELTVKGKSIKGYVKPLFREMKVYDRRQDKEKSTFHKLYEMLVGGVAKLLENPPRHEIATVTPLTGKVSSPKTSTWQAIVNIFRNAFFHAILPGFEKNIKR